MSVLLAGVDEAGRGPLAGPVVAAAVILDPKRPIRGLRDSKQLTPERRAVLALRIRERAIGMGGARAGCAADHRRRSAGARRGEVGCVALDLTEDCFDIRFSMKTF